MSRPQWRRAAASASHWLLVDGKHLIAEVEAVIANPSKPAAYRIDEQDAEIAPDLRTAMERCERHYGLNGEDFACGRRITQKAPPKRG